MKFRNGEDAAEAKYHLNHTVIGGREIAIVFAAENRKTPREMRKTGRVRWLRMTLSFHPFVSYIFVFVFNNLLCLLSAVAVLGEALED